jgi:alkanesulfonate monooxygenase SsuD/methylene tetrahydromethanopterin reductase-like flavin-dependent oxidoreductase (luciferase family)
MYLSVLNFFSDPHEIVELAAVLEELDCFERFWIGEHHSLGQVPDPLALTLLVASRTKRIRIGTGAVSLAFRNPYLIAETALMAELLLPGRIDLGVTRSASVSDELFVLLTIGTSYKETNDSYDQRLRILRDALTRNLDGKELFLKSVLRHGPPLYLMGVTANRAKQAGELGIGFVTSFHHGGSVESIREFLAAYHSNFVPSPTFEEPYTIVVVSGYISDDPTKLQSAREEEEALKARAGGNFPQRPMIFDSAHSAATRLRSMGAAVGADEIMFLCVSRDCDSCYRALAQGWVTTRPPVTTPAGLVQPR